MRLHLYQLVSGTLTKQDMPRSATVLWSRQGDSPLNTVGGNGPSVKSERPNRKGGLKRKPGAQSVIARPFLLDLHSSLVSRSQPHTKTSPPLPHAGAFLVQPPNAVAKGRRVFSAIVTQLMIDNKQVCEDLLDQNLCLRRTRFLHRLENT